MSFSYATVTGAVQLNPRLRRITVHVDNPGALAVRRAGDSAVGVYFPVTGPDGTRSADPASGAAGRNYTVRRHDGARLDLDFVLHARGPGTTWASTTGPGARVGLDHARSWHAPPPTADWQLLVADLAGLPAVARIIEELPRGMPATAVVEVADRADLDYLPVHPDLTVIPHVGSGNGHGPSSLAELVREFRLPDGHGYCWFGGEAAESRAVRKHLRGLGWAVEQYDVTGYWRVDSETWDARYALVGDQLLAVYQSALSDGEGDKVAAEEFDEALERAGL